MRRSPLFAPHPRPPRCRRPQGTRCNSAQAGKLDLLKELQASTRLGRVLRLFRVVRVIKLLSNLRKRPAKADGGDEEGEVEHPSAVGKKLNELIVQKVIMAVLVIMVVFPLLGVSDSQHGWTQKRAIEGGLLLFAKGFSESAVGTESFQASDAPHCP